MRPMGDTASAATQDRCGMMPGAPAEGAMGDEMVTEPVTVLLVGLDEAAAHRLAREEDLAVRGVAALAALAPPVEADVVVLALDGSAPLEAIRDVRAQVPEAALLVVTDAGRAADGAIALHAGAEDHLLRDELLPALLPRAIRYAVAIRQARRELATVDETTQLPNLRGFAAVAEHHLHMADRAGRSVVFVFVRLDDYAELRKTLGAPAAEELARDAATVLLEAVRDSDAPARVADDTLCILLTGEAGGAETLVLSRLVEAMAMHDASRERPRSLSLSVGTARYEPGSDASLASILESAVRGLAVHERP